MVADASDRTERGSRITLMKEHRIPVRLTDQFAIMHDKFMVIDGQTVNLEVSITRQRPSAGTPRTCLCCITRRTSLPATRPGEAIWNGGD